VITDSGRMKPASEGSTNSDPAKPANEVITGFGVELRGSGSKSPKRISDASAYEPFREAIELVY